MKRNAKQYVHEYVWYRPHVRVDYVGANEKKIQSLRPSYAFLPTRIIVGGEQLPHEHFAGFKTWMNVCFTQCVLIHS